MADIQILTTDEIDEFRFKPFHTPIKEFEDICELEKYKEHIIIEQMDVKFKWNLVKSNLEKDVGKDITVNIIFYDDVTNRLYRVRIANGK